MKIHNYIFRNIIFKQTIIFSEHSNHKQKQNTFISLKFGLQFKFGFLPKPLCRIFSVTEWGEKKDKVFFSNLPSNISYVFTNQMVFVACNPQTKLPIVLNFNFEFVEFNFYYIFVWKYMQGMKLISGFLGVHKRVHNFQRRIHSTPTIPTPPNFHSIFYIFAKRILINFIYCVLLNKNIWISLFFCLN